MWRIASCVVLATSALAGYVPYTGLQAQRSHQNYAPSGAFYPIDFNDDFHINNPFVKPGSPMVFRFEQLRSNQPSQVDIREEEIGKYMYRQQSTTTTTTTTPEPIPEPVLVLDNADINVDNTHNYQTQPQANVWPDYMTETAKNFASMVSKQNDFPLNIPDSSRIDPKTRYPEVDRWQPTQTANWEGFAEDIHNAKSTVEPKQEDISWNMYRQKQSTTTTTSTPAPTPEPVIILDDADINVENNGMYQTQPQPAANIWPNYMTETAKNFASMVSNQNDFSLNVPDSRHINPKTRYPEVDTWQQRPRTSPPPAPTMNWEEFAENMRHNPIQQVQQKPEFSVPQVEIKKEPSTAWEWTQMPASSTTQAPQHRQPMTNRGSHKFKWDDLAVDLKSTTEVPTSRSSDTVSELISTTPSAPLNHRGPPPAVPTLSSWYGDNFGR